MRHAKSDHWRLSVVHAMPQIAEWLIDQEIKDLTSLQSHWMNHCTHTQQWTCHCSWEWLILARKCTSQQGLIFQLQMHWLDTFTLDEKCSACLSAAHHHFLACRFHELWCSPPLSCMQSSQALRVVLTHCMISWRICGELAAKACTINFSTTVGLGCGGTVGVWWGWCLVIACDKLVQLHGKDGPLWWQFSLTLQNTSWVCHCALQCTCT